MEHLQIVQQALGVKSWEKGTFRNYYFIGQYNGKQLNGCLECEFSELNNYNPAFLTSIMEGLAELDQRAHGQIQEKFPEDDANELELNDLIVMPTGVFKLGYYTGRTPLGETYIYVSFTPDFIMHENVAVEGY